MSWNKDQDLRKLFCDPRIPDADLTGSVMTKLHAGQTKKERFFVKYKVSLLVLAGMLLTASTGFATVQYQSLKNKEGEIVYQVKPLKEAPHSKQKRSEEDILRFRKIFELEDKLLKNGEAALIYVVPHNSKHKAELRFKPAIFQNLSQLRGKIADKSITIPERVNGDYKFKQATVLFKSVLDVNPPSAKEEAAIAEKLRKQAEESNKEYAIMPVEMSDQIFHISLEYKNGKDKIDVIIRSSGDNQPSMHYIDEKIDFKQQKIDVKGVEMLYTDYSSSHEIAWVYESPDKKQKHTYKIQANTDKVSKEDMIKIAEAYLK